MRNREDIKFHFKNILVYDIFVNTCISSGRDSDVTVQSGV